MKTFNRFIVDATANPKNDSPRTSSKIITLPNQMGTIKVVKSTTAGESGWTFEYQDDFRGEIFKGEIVLGWAREGGNGYSVLKVTNAVGKVKTNFLETHKTISAAVLHAVSMLKYEKK